jgi:hypothetical protein
MQKQENPNLAMAETGLARLALGFLKIKKQNRDANIIAASNAKLGPLAIGFDIPKRKVIVDPFWYRSCWGTRFWRLFSGLTGEIKRNLINQPK